MAKSKNISFQKVLLVRSERLRKLCGMTHDEFLKKIELSAEEYNAILAGDEDLSCAYAEHIAKCFGISIYLMAGPQNFFEEVAGLIAAKVAHGSDCH